MEHNEIILLRNRIIIGIIIALIFVVPLTIFLINKLTPQEPTIIKAINTNEQVILLVTSNNCSNCSSIKNIINDLEIKKFIINKDKDRIEYDKILTGIEMLDSDIISPTIIYFENSKLISSLVDIKNKEDLLVFLNNYNIKME